jgi:hypothetical protein
MYITMVYTEAVRRAVLNYRRKNKETISIQVCEQVRRHRAKWKPYLEETKRLGMISI